MAQHFSERQRIAVRNVHQRVELIEPSGSLIHGCDAVDDGCNFVSVHTVEDDSDIGICKPTGRQRVIENRWPKRRSCAIGDNDHELTACGSEDVSK